MKSRLGQVQIDVCCFESIKQKKEMESRKVSFFEVQGRLLTSKKERKNYNFRKVKNMKKLFFVSLFLLFLFSFSSCGIYENCPGEGNIDKNTEIKV